MLSFHDLCRYLADEGGGFTLWLGAGAGIALTRNTLPGWGGLVTTMAEGHPPPTEWPALDMPSKLEWISSQVGHAAFRKALRDNLVTPLLTAAIDYDFLRAQAVIGMRASAIVSFNIEMASSLMVARARGGGAHITRTYTARENKTIGGLRATGGATSVPVYHPHGLLDVSGSCVMTKSEYDVHGMSLAVGTAINLCLGGDLVILGMSMADDYLRHAMLSGRRFLRNVFWVNSSFSFKEWARAADVYCVHAEHAEVWNGIAATMLDHDRGGELKRRLEFLEPLLPKALNSYLDYLKSIPRVLEKASAMYRDNSTHTTRDLLSFIRDCEELGCDVPVGTRDDPRLNESPLKRNTFDVEREAPRPPEPGTPFNVSAARTNDVF